MNDLSHFGCITLLLAGLIGVASAATIAANNHRLARSLAVDETQHHFHAARRRPGECSNPMSHLTPQEELIMSTWDNGHSMMAVARAALKAEGQNGIA